MAAILDFLDPCEFLCVPSFDWWLPWIRLTIIIELSLSVCQ